MSTLHLSNLVGVFNANLAPGLPNWNNIPTIGGTLQLAAVEFLTTGTIRSAATWTYSSDNTAVATVNSSTGLVTGVSSGTCHITATSDDMQVGVLPIGVALLSLGSSTIAFGSSTTVTCTGGTAFNTNWSTGAPGCTSLVAPTADPLSLGRIVGGQVTVKSDFGMTLTGSPVPAHVPIVCSFQTGDLTIPNALQGCALPNVIFGGIYASTTLTVTGVPGWQGA
ncbi:MAG TPA: Ig-like domain-containing protein [Candidatus Sulfotelmatobacter sp.]|nr:Ig-like domain-containing protein [Candidatus Sulfotelmatobacter sp.]